MNLLLVIFNSPTEDSIDTIKFTKNEIKGVCEIDNLWNLVSNYVDKEELNLLHFNKDTGAIYDEVFGRNYGVALKIKFKGAINYV